MVMDTMYPRWSLLTLQEKKIILYCWYQRLKITLFVHVSNFKLASKWGLFLALKAKIIFLVSTYPICTSSLSQVQHNIQKFFLLLIYSNCWHDTILNNLKLALYQTSLEECYDYIGTIMHGCTIVSNPSW